LARVVLVGLYCSKAGYFVMSHYIIEVEPDAPTQIKEYAVSHSNEFGTPSVSTNVLMISVPHQPFPIRRQSAKDEVVHDFIRARC